MIIIERIVILMLILVVLYLVLANSSGFNSVMGGLGKFNIASLLTLQGRDCINAFGVKIGCESTGVDVIFD
jgi:hypothetical protein